MGIWGRDELAGGMWLAVQMRGKVFEKLGVITNVREPLSKVYSSVASRGCIIREFVSSSSSASEYAGGIDGERYAGFNLLLADRTGVTFCSNRGSGEPGSEEGIVSFSNETMVPKTQWPKVCHGRAAFERIVREDAGSNDDDALVNKLLEMMRDTTRFDGLPGILPRDFEEALSSVCVSVCCTPVDGLEYATRTNTVLLVRKSGEVTFAEANACDGGGRWELKVHRLQEHSLARPPKRMHPLFAAKSRQSIPLKKVKASFSVENALKRMRDVLGQSAPASDDPLKRLLRKNMGALSEPWMTFSAALQRLVLILMPRCLPRSLLSLHWLKATRSVQ